jgi:hypothetical protein
MTTIMNILAIAVVAFIGLAIGSVPVREHKPTPKSER